MGSMRIYGIGATEALDNVGEKVLLDGLDISRLRGLKDEHPEQENFFHLVGAVTYAKKIKSEKECENEYQRRCWNHVKAPFLYAEGVLADDENHPNAQSAAAMIKFTQRPDIPLKMGFSVDGGILERRDESGRPSENGKILSRAIATNLSLTVKPCNPQCRVWMFNDLTKSDMAMKPPARYWQELHKSEKKSSIIEDTNFKLYLRLESLKKSLQDYFDGFTSIKCHNCGQGIRFFKSGDVPNGCHSCGTHFSLSSIWKALNK
jgi:ribosomal protein S27E